jgi:hypothetical protein
MTLPRFTKSFTTQQEPILVDGIAAAIEAS